MASLLFCPLTNGNCHPAFLGLPRSQRSCRLRVFAAATAATETATDQAVDCVVVGAGVSGLTCAFSLQQSIKGRSSVLVTEARERVGGNITTRQEDGYIWEEGPNSFQPGDPILELACDVGLGDDIVLADPSSYRFVLWEGKLRALPAGPEDALFGDFMTFPGKIRAGLGAIGIRPPAPDHEESVKEFVSRNLGLEAFQRLIEPFCSGVYAGDPAALSASAATGRVQVLEEKHGSLVAGALALMQEKKRKKEAGEIPPRDPRLPEVKGQTVGSFRYGLQQLPKALSDNLGKDVVKTGWKLASLNKETDLELGDIFILNYETPEGLTTVKAKSVVLTTPAWVTASILEEFSPQSSAALRKFVYPAVYSVTVVYPRESIRKPTHGKTEYGAQGFGQLHPRSEGVRTLGTIYSSSLFPGRIQSPQDEVMLLHYIGGAQDPGIKDLTPDEVVAQTHKDALQTLLKEGTEPPRVLGVRLWERAIPQFNVGHNALLSEAKSHLPDGLFLGGNYAGGVALGRCVEFSRDQGKEIANYIQEQSSVPVPK